MLPEGGTVRVLGRRSRGSSGALRQVRDRREAQRSGFDACEGRPHQCRGVAGVRGEQRGVGDRRRRVATELGEAAGRRVESSEHQLGLAAVVGQGFFAGAAVLETILALEGVGALDDRGDSHNQELCTQRNARRCEVALTRVVAAHGAGEVELTAGRGVHERFGIRHQVARATRQRHVNTIIQ